MKCRVCHRRFKVITGGHGESDSPGLYFYGGIAMGIVVAFLFVGRVDVWRWTLLPVPPFLFGWAFVARGDCYNPTCPHCGHENDRGIIRPWSM